MPVRKLRSMSLSKLAVVASVGGIAVCGAGLLLQWSMLRKFRNSEPFRLSLHNFKAHKPLMEFVGEPVALSNPDLGNEEENYSTESEAKFTVPFKGKKQEGAMHFEASRNAAEANSSWRLDKLQVSVASRPADRVVVPIAFATAKDVEAESKEGAPKAS